MNQWEDRIRNIQEVRSRNNINWMEILKIALEHAPERTKKVLIDILDADIEISDELQLLIHEHSK
jgi:hypothetical protein